MGEDRPDITPAPDGWTPENAHAICDKCGEKYTQHADGVGVTGPREEVRGLAQAMGGWTESKGQLFCIGCAPSGIAAQLEAEADAAPAELEVPDALKRNDPTPEESSVVDGWVYVVISEKALCGVFNTKMEADDLASLVRGMTDVVVDVHDWFVGRFGFRPLPSKADRLNDTLAKEMRDKHAKRLARKVIPVEEEPVPVAIPGEVALGD